MEANRDDFIIAIRSAFLKKGTKQRFSLVALICFSILILTLGKFDFKVINYAKISLKEVVYRSSFIISIPENYLKNTVTKVKDHFYFYNDYQNIRTELKELKAKDKVGSYIISENKRLKKIIDDFVVTPEEIIAKVLIDKKSPFLKSIVLSKGSKDNIKLGMAVLNDAYLVGKVVEVNYLTSRILLITDLNSKIPVTIEPEGILAILSGTGKNHGIIQYLNQDNEIGGGSVVYTSGSGGIFKAGIPVGKIKNINEDPKIGKEVIFFSDLTQLRFVKIVSFKGKNS